MHMNTQRCYSFCRNFKDLFNFLLHDYLPSDNLFLWDEFLSRVNCIYLLIIVKIIYCINKLTFKIRNGNRKPLFLSLFLSILC